MPAALILNQSQAEAVYSAMCALNNVKGYGMVGMPVPRDSDVQVRWESSGAVEVSKGRHLGKREQYANQSAFATAYGLLPREPVAEVAENFVFMLRKQPNGDRWPVGTKLYA